MLNELMCEIVGVSFDHSLFVYCEDLCHYTHAIRKELLIPVLCGIFLIENLSVVLQVAWFRHTKKKYGEGRRIFRMSPLHHHYQKNGMPESKITARFWIIGILLAVFTIVTLKVR